MTKPSVVRVWKCCAPCHLAGLADLADLADFTNRTNLTGIPGLPSVPTAASLQCMFRYQKTWHIEIGPKLEQ